MNNMRNKILSLLVLLLTAASGAWAEQTVVMPGLMAPTDNSTTIDENTWKWVQVWTVANNLYMDFEIKDGSQFTGDFTPTRTQLINGLKAYGLDVCGENGKVSTVQLLSADGKVLKTAEINKALVYDAATRIKVAKEFFAEMTTDKDYIIRVNLGETTIAWDAATKKATFSMPANDLVLTPIYSAATIYDADGQTEKAAYASFKEAFLAVQDGEVIVLDDNVTITTTTDLSTGNRATTDPVKFTIDFNGYVLDGSGAATTFMDTQHDGDQITFIDSSEGQTGGLKGLVTGKANSFVFESGRYSFGGMTATEIKEGWSMLAPVGYILPDGKVFIDIENAPDANGFMVYVDYKPYELAIGAGKFTTFFADHNIKLDEATAEGVGLYTIKGDGINADRSEITVTAITGIVLANTPMIVYNGTEQKQTVKIKLTNEVSTNSLMWSSHFQGTAVDREFTADDMAKADYYALSGGKAFARVKGAGTLKANQCWLQFEKQQSAGAHSFTLVFENGDMTGIKAIDNGQFSQRECGDARTIDNYYDLSGRKLDKKPTTKGVYIQNGKKVVVK